MTNGEGPGDSPGPSHYAHKEYTAVIQESTRVQILDLVPENIPEELKRRPQWVIWRLEERGGKPTKVPYGPNTDRRASTTDLMTWATFDRALVCYAFMKGHSTKIAPDAVPFDGIGFVFSSADPFCGIDLDGCRDPETGEISPWARKIISSAEEGYVEISPSGTGIHIIVEGKVRGGGMRKGPVEMYSRNRFFTITGVLL
jgi:primase-polymerase (primpol)-like protein